MLLSSVKVPAVCNDAWKEIDPVGKNILVLSNSGPMVPVAAKSLQGWYYWHDLRANRCLPSPNITRGLKASSHLGSWETYTFEGMAHIHIKSLLTWIWEMEMEDNISDGICFHRWDSHRIKALIPEAAVLRLFWFCWFLTVIHIPAPLN